MTPRVLVYVQAVPNAVPSGAKKFQDLSRSRFILSHSSKTALSKASEIFKGAEIDAAGYYKVLRETLSHGVKNVISLPLCDDPLEQAKSFPSGESYSHILVGENPDGPFTGASLCGALAALRKMDLDFENDFLEGTSSGRRVILVREDQNTSQSIDIRRINYSMSREVSESDVRGKSSIENVDSSQGEIISSRAPSEISAIIQRRLRRFVVE